MTGTRTTTPPPAIPPFLSMVDMGAALDSASDEGERSQSPRSPRVAVLKKIITVPSASGPGISTMRRPTRTDIEVEQPPPLPIRCSTDGALDAVLVDFDDCM